MSRYPRETELLDLDLQREVAARIRDERQKMGWSVIRLANEIGVSESTLYDIESGRIACTMRNLHWLSKVFCVPIGYLIYGDRAKECECLELEKLIKDLDYGEQMRWVSAIQGFYKRRIEKNLSK